MQETREIPSMPEHRLGTRCGERFCKNRGTPGRCERSSASASVGGCTRPFGGGRRFQFVCRLKSLKFDESLKSTSCENCSAWGAERTSAFTISPYFSHPPNITSAMNRCPSAYSPPRERCRIQGFCSTAQLVSGSSVLDDRYPNSRAWWFAACVWRLRSAAVG
jgi:hypothetical protein